VKLFHCVSADLHFSTDPFFCTTQCLNISLADVKGHFGTKSITV